MIWSGTGPSVHLQIVVDRTNAVKVILPCCDCPTWLITWATLMSRYFSTMIGPDTISRPSSTLKAKHRLESTREPGGPSSSTQRTGSRRSRSSNMAVIGVEIPAVEERKRRKHLFCSSVVQAIHCLSTLLVSSSCVIPTASVEMSGCADLVDDDRPRDGNRLLKESTCYVAVWCMR